MCHLMNIIHNLRAIIHLMDQLERSYPLHRKSMASSRALPAESRALQLFSDSCCRICRVIRCGELFDGHSCGSNPYLSFFFAQNKKHNSIYFHSRPNTAQLSEHDFNSILVYVNSSRNNLSQSWSSIKEWGIFISLNYAVRLAPLSTPPSLR